MSMFSRTKRRVVIVDDSRTIQAMLDTAFGLRRDFVVVGVCGDARSAVEMVKRLVPDLVTIDLCMPYIDGASLLEMISGLNGICKVIVSDQSAKSVLMTAKLVEMGASACLGKRELVDDPESFFKKINAACSAAELVRKNRAISVGDAAPHRDIAADVPVKPPRTRSPISAFQSPRMSRFACKSFAVNNWGTRPASDSSIWRPTIWRR